MILLSAEQALKAPQIALIVRESERTIQRWLERYQAEGINALQDAPKSGKPSKVSQAYRQLLLSGVRQRPRSVPNTRLAVLIRTTCLKKRSAVAGG